jgi:hypothetical protein
MPLFRTPAITQELQKQRRITTALDATAIIKCSRAAAASIPPKKTLLGLTGHRAYTHRKTGRPTVGFGNLNRDGELLLPDWTVEFSPDGQSFMLTWAKLHNKRIDSEQELVRFYEAFTQELHRCDPSAVIEVVDG